MELTTRRLKCVKKRRTQMMSKSKITGPGQKELQMPTGRTRYDDENEEEK